MLEHYDIVANDTNFTYESYSIGKKGIICKIVRFVRLRDTNYFRFGFADFDEQTGQLNDKVISNNGDTILILGTLGIIIDDFVNKFPDAWIYAKGNTNSRTRLYRIILSQNLQMIEQKYQLFGMYKGVWKPYIPNQPYSEFILNKKNNMITRTNISIIDKDIIVFPSKHQSAVEAYINIPLPGEAPLLPTQKIIILLDEIKQINLSLDYYMARKDNDAVAELLMMKEKFTSILQDIMANQFKITFLKQAA